MQYKKIILQNFAAGLAEFFEWEYSDTRFFKYVIHGTKEQGRRELVYLMNAGIWMSIKDHIKNANNWFDTHANTVIDELHPELLPLVIDQAAKYHTKNVHKFLAM